MWNRSGGATEAQDPRQRDDPPGAPLRIAGRRALQPIRRDLP